MKANLLLCVILFLLQCILSAQERGVTPADNPQSTIRNPHSATYAVVVGISNYQSDNIPDLRFADKDAQAFANFLRSPAGGGLDEDHLKVLINEEATAGKVAANLYWLMDECREGDQVVIYFSGHGDAEDRFKRQPGFLLCWDAPEKVYLAGGVIDLRLLQDVISSLSLDTKAKVLVVTDACRSGKLSGSDYNGAQVTAASLQKQFANEIKILSCQPDEYSIEGEQWGGGRGAFSYHLLDGLYGMADGNADGIVDLKEIGRYLEDKVAQEVAPEHQNPMTIGSRTEKLTDVFPDLLAQLREGRKGQLQLFSPTDSRGIEGEVLARADSNLVEMYHAFQVALAEKHFLGPEGACADYYFGILSQEPQLERLHSSMRRNYAAALQDDAQQLLNLMLRGGMTSRNIKGNTKDYEPYPRYLEKAADLLGPDNYMYPVLQARKYFLTAYLLTDKLEKRKNLFKALEWDSEMPHAFNYLIETYIQEPDSALYYFDKVTSLTPSWTYPYIFLGSMYAMNKDWDKAVETWLQGLQVDSNSVLLRLQLASVYSIMERYELAEPLLIYVIDKKPPGACIPCLMSMLAHIYAIEGRPEESIPLLKEGIELDSNSTNLHNDLGWTYLLMDSLAEAEKHFLKSMELDSHHIHPPANLGLVYTKMGRYAEADKMFKKGLELAPDNLDVLVNYAVYYSLQNQADKAYEYLEAALARGYVNNDHIEIPDEPAFDLLRKDKERWDTLMKKYYPNHPKN
ncbi:MAG: tetratricopeptide repeat protein [Lewinellaceae bacterium]|nr:tetratricopeptide repeat protein [Lewinellaceae bacterium]